MLSQQTASRITALIGALAVALGAFGAHGLEGFLTRTERLATWETAVLYHLIHSVVLLALALSGAWRPRTWLVFAAGIVIFSGTLYLLCLTGITWLGAITPIGGLLLIVGWILTAIKCKN